MAGPKDRVAHLSEIVDPYVVDRSVLVREVDFHVFSVELSHGRSLRVLERKETQDRIDYPA
jgi:hypothetical protein